MNMLTLWHWDSMPGVICRRLEFKGLCKSSHNWFLAVVDIPHFGHYCVLKIRYLWQCKIICFLIHLLGCGLLPIIVHKVKHVLYRYFPDEGGGGVVLYVGKYSK